MGKGQGCIPSKSRSKASLTASPQLEGGQPPHTGANHHHQEEEEEGEETREEQTSSSLPTNRKLRIFIVYYSMYGHIEILAKKIKEGIDSVEGVEGCLYRVAETLPKSVLEKMRVPAMDESIPVITAGELPAADAVVFGFPTRYGMMAAQMKAFFDSTGQLWRGQQLAGKPAGIFVSTGTQGGGQETTAWTAITQLSHHGMLFIPIGYTFGAGMFRMDECRGGSPYGAGTFAGDGSRKPSETELALAEHQGKYTAAIVKRLVG